MYKRQKPILRYGMNFDIYLQDKKTNVIHFMTADQSLKLADAEGKKQAEIRFFNWTGFTRSG